MINKFEEYKKIRSQLANPNYNVELETLIGTKESIDLKEYYTYLFTDENNSTPSRIYATSNENLNKLYKELNLINKKILTVGSSGDQALYAILNGCKDITIADLNIYTQVFVEFKIACIKALNKEEFLGVLYDLKYTHDRFFRSKTTYSKICKYLNGKTKNFWDNVMLEGNKEILFGLFHPYCESVYDKLDYDSLKLALLKNDYNINYVFANYEEFPEVLNEKYDIILLSNIKDYFEKQSVINVDMEEIFYKVLTKLYRNNLNQNGLIQINSWKTFDVADTLNLPKHFEKKTS